MIWVLPTSPASRAAPVSSCSSFSETWHLPCHAALSWVLLMILEENAIFPLLLAVLVCTPHSKVEIVFLGCFVLWFWTLNPALNMLGKCYNTKVYPQSSCSVFEMAAVLPPQEMSNSCHLLDASFWRQVRFFVCLFEIRSCYVHWIHYIAQTGLKLVAILLPQPPKG